MSAGDTTRTLFFTFLPMKNIKIYSLFGLIALFLACGNTDNESSFSAEDSIVLERAMPYIMALADYNIEAARPFATEETQRITLDFIESDIMPTVDSAYIKQNTPAQISVDSVIFSSDTTANVFYRKTTPIQSNSPASVEMRLRNGQWFAHQLVDFTVHMSTHSQEK